MRKILEKANISTKVNDRLQNVSLPCDPAHFDFNSFRHICLLVVTMENLKSVNRNGRLADSGF
jgi:hypothetical protein